MTSPLTTFHCSFINQKQFHAAVCLYNIRSQKMSTVIGTSVMHLAASRVPLLCSCRILTFTNIDEFCQSIHSRLYFDFKECW